MGVIDHALCAQFAEAYDACARPSALTDHHGNPLVNWNEARLTEATASAILTTIGRLRDVTAAAFAESALHPETALIARLNDGQGHIAHADNEQLVNGRWVANHTPHRDYVGLLYLNSDFTGGELRFPGNPVESPVRPEEGLYVSFPCTRDFLHEVTEVERGRRYTLAVWFTRRLEHADVALSWLVGEPQTETTS